MAVISQIKATSDNVNYNIRDDYSTWGGRNLLLGTSWNDTTAFTNDVNKTGWYRLEPNIDTLDTTHQHNGFNSVRRLRSGTTATSWSEFKYYCRDGKTLIPGEQYTLSWWQYSQSATWYGSYSTNYLTSNIRYYNSSGTKIADSSTMQSGNTIFKPSATNTWEYKTSLFTVPTAAEDHVWWYIYFSIPRDIDLNLCCFKLEHGNKATDWSPAPEDIARFIGDETIELYSE